MYKCRKIIFLDWDGVVSTDRARLAYPNDIFAVDPVAVRLISMLAEKSEAKIVISSQRRVLLDFRPRFAASGFSPDLLHDDWRTVPTIKGRSRVEEMQEWLSQHPEITNWIAIDDEPLDTDHLIHTPSNDGFLSGHYFEGCKKLGAGESAFSNSYWRARVGFEGPDHIAALPEVRRAIDRLKIPDRKP